MIYLPRLAFKNLSRYKRRTMITAGALAYGLMLFIVTRSLLLGIDRESERNLWWYETGAGRLMAEGYWEDHKNFPLKKSFQPHHLAPLLDDQGMTWAPRINFTGDLIFYKDPFPEDGQIPALFTAIDPLRDAEVFRLQHSLIAGKWLNNDKPGLLIGRWLAEDIGAEIGHIFLVQTQTKDGYAQVFDLEVQGILDCPNPEITRSGLYLPLSFANEFLEMENSVTEINLKYTPGKNSEAAFLNLATEVEKIAIEAVPWQVLGEDFIAMSETKKVSTAVIIFLILFIAAVGVSNTMLMAVYERVRELGMMRALGLRKRHIRFLFVWESAGIGILGGLYGLGLGALVNWPLVKWGIDYSSLMRDNSFGYRIQGKMFGVWDWPSFLIAFGLGVLMTVLVAALGSNRVLRLDIPSSLHFE